MEALGSVLLSELMKVLFKHDFLRETYPTLASHEAEGNPCWYQRTLSISTPGMWTGLFVDFPVPCTRQGLHCVGIDPRSLQ